MQRRGAAGWLGVALEDSPLSGWSTEIVKPCPRLNSLSSLWWLSITSTKGLDLVVLSPEQRSNDPAWCRGSLEYLCPLNLTLGDGAEARLCERASKLNSLVLEATDVPGSLIHLKGIVDVCLTWVWDKSRTHWGYVNTVLMMFLVIHDYWDRIWLRWWKQIVHRGITRMADS